MASRGPEKISNASRSSYSSILNSFISTDMIDQGSVERCLLKCIKTETPENIQLIKAIVMPRFSSYRYPDGKVIQTEINEACFSPSKSRQLMKKFWSMLSEEQSRKLAPPEYRDDDIQESAPVSAARSPSLSASSSPQSSDVLPKAASWYPDHLEDSSRKEHSVPKCRESTHHTSHFEGNSSTLPYRYSPAWDTSPTQDPPQQSYLFWH